MVEIRPGAKARRENAQGSGVGLIDMAMAKSAKESVLGVEDVIASDVPIIPILNDAPLELKIVPQGIAIGVLDSVARPAIRLGIEIEVSQTRGVLAVYGDDVRLRAIAFELQGAVRIAWSGRHRAVGRGVVDRTASRQGESASECRIQQLREVSLAHHV